MGAVISACGLYRHSLDRYIGGAGLDGLVAAFFGVNPSTADAEIDDATVRKWIGFSSRNKIGAFFVGNVFDYRATNVNELARCSAPVSPDCDRYLLEIIDKADVLIPCWGNRSKVPPKLWWRFGVVKTMLRDSGKPVKIFGRSKSGDPLHPLMLSYDTPLIEWKL